MADGGPRKYDFNRPHNISRTFEQNLQSIAENFAKTGGIDFTSLLRMTTAVEDQPFRAFDVDLHPRRWAVAKDVIEC